MEKNEELSEATRINPKNGSKDIENTSRSSNFIEDSPNRSLIHDLKCLFLTSNCLNLSS